MQEVLAGEVGREQEGTEEFQMMPSHHTVSSPSMTWPGWQENLRTEPGMTGKPSQVVRVSLWRLGAWPGSSQPSLTQRGTLAGTHLPRSHTA